MKKLFFLAALMLATVCTTQAQNVQLHYDFGRDMNKALNADNGNRQRMTLTYETFSADKWGSWFYFVDTSSSSCCRSTASSWPCP